MLRPYAEAPIPGHSVDAAVDKKLRLASSSPDIKALFKKSPLRIYNPFDRTESHLSRWSYDYDVERRHATNHWMALPQNVS